MARKRVPEDERKISNCPSWLTLSEDRRSFVFLPERAQILKQIFELSIGGLGSYFIANHLNRQNVPAFPPSKRWDHTTIDSMLRNRATFGEHQPKSYVGGNKKGVPLGPPIPGYYPPAIDQSLYEAAQVARQQNLSSRRGRKGENITNLFGDLTTCYYCNSPVKFYSNGNEKSLICLQVLQSSGCFRSGWSYRNFESTVLHFLAHPCLVDALEEKDREVIDEIVDHIKHLLGDNSYAARFEIALKLKKVVSELKLASAGLDPNLSWPEALIRRDNPRRFFEIVFRNGQTYAGIPIGP